MTQDITITTMNSPIGPLVLGADKTHLLSIKINASNTGATVKEFQRLGYQTSLGDSERLQHVKHELNEYFNGTRKAFTLDVRLIGTPFQTAVWEALMTVPYGEIVTYGQLVSLADKPKAARAVGTAMNKNRIPIVVPCHRVVAAGFHLGGFGCGTDIKQALLQLEGSLALICLE